MKLRRKLPVRLTDQSLLTKIKFFNSNCHCLASPLALEPEITDICADRGQIVPVH
eukprot:Pgem_evm1s19662